MRRTLIATVVATAALSVNTPWAVGSAVEPSGDNVDISPREWSEGEVWSQVDPHDPGLRSYAEEFNLGLDEAYRNLSVQEEVGRRRVAMREAAGADYATTSMVHDAAGTVRLHTRTLEAAQRMVDAYVDEKGPRVRFEFVPALYSLLELSDALDEVLLRLGLLTERGDMGNGAESARAMIDPVAGEIVVSYDHDFAAERTRETGTASGPPVRYLRVQDDITAEQDSCAVSSCDMPLHGGLAVTDSSGTCTIGFNAHVAGDAKLLSAGHCSNGVGDGWNHNRPSNTNDYVGALEYAIDQPQMDVARVNVVDASWEQTPMNSVYRRASSELATSIPNFAITARNGEPGMLDWVCRSGATLGEKCGTAFGFMASGGQIYKVVVEDAKACRGDSGGPWYTIGRSAYGLHESSSDQTDDCSESESEESYAYTILAAEIDAGATVVTSGSRSPIGHLDVATRGPGYIRVEGWAVDPDVLTPITIHIYVDVTFYNIGSASNTRADVDAVYPLYDADVGFAANVAVGPGPNTVCAYGINVSLGTNVGLGCIVVS